MKFHLEINKTFEQIRNKCCHLKPNLNSEYRELNIVFAGGLRQLEPVGAHKQPIYVEPCMIFPRLD